MLAYRRLALRRRVIVNLKSGKAIRGVLTRKAGPLLELRDAELFDTPGMPAAQVVGAIVVERSNVDFVQVIGEV